MLEVVRGTVERARHTFRPPRASWSYRYQLMADQSGPMSAIPLLAFQEKRFQAHAKFEGAPEPHPIRGFDEQTREKARREVTDGE